MLVRQPHVCAHDLFTCVFKHTAYGWLDLETACPFRIAVIHTTYSYSDTMEAVIADYQRNICCTLWETSALEGDENFQAR